MSVNRENVLWRSEDGTWNIGFFDFYETGDPDDRDFEWDVEYNFDRFNWCSMGHATAQAARDAWDGANPGGGQVIEDIGQESRQYDAMAKTWTEEQQALAREQRSWVRRY